MKYLKFCLVSKIKSSLKFITFLIINLIQHALASFRFPIHQFHNYHITVDRKSTFLKLGEAIKIQNQIIKQKNVTFTQSYSQPNCILELQLVNLSPHSLLQALSPSNFYLYM